MGGLGVWLFTIGLFWAAFKRERGSCLESRVSWCAGDVSGLDRLYHLGGSREGTMEKGAKAFSPTRDRTFASPHSFRSIIIDRPLHVCERR